MLKIFGVLYFRVCFIHVTEYADKTKHIEAAPPCFSSFPQNAMLLQLHHADWHTYQF